MTTNNTPTKQPDANNRASRGCSNRLVVHRSTPITDESVDRAEKNGMSPIIEYCYANDARKLEVENATMKDALNEMLRRSYNEMELRRIARETLASLPKRP